MKDKSMKNRKVIIVPKATYPELRRKQKNDNKPIYRKQRHHETSQLDNEIFEERPQALKDNSFYSKRNNF